VRKCLRCFTLWCQRRFTRHLRSCHFGTTLWDFA
jgi:uncharacterized UBP type Zn finger protein